MIVFFLAVDVPPSDLSFFGVLAKMAIELPLADGLPVRLVILRTRLVGPISRAFSSEPKRLSLPSTFLIPLLEQSLAAGATVGLALLIEVHGGSDNFQTTMAGIASHSLPNFLEDLQLQLVLNILSVAPLQGMLVHFPLVLVGLDGNEGDSDRRGLCVRSVVVSPRELPQLVECVSEF